jgi:alanyl-tRNA synthetase
MLKYDSMMTHRELRKLFSDFWSQRDHVEVQAAPLVLQNDATTLFTSSGMQPLVPYLLGEVHPQGKRLFDIQPSIRTQDIEEVGNNRHTTFFEMMGNWSLGDYFKKEQLTWKWELLTKVLNLPQDKLYVSIFEGGDGVEKDTESEKIWKELGVADDHIYQYGTSKNWWSRSGPPEKMPAGEIGGPDSEVFYDFGTPHDENYGKTCHPNCDCGRFMEIGNSVFIQYQKNPDGSLKQLSQKNVDFGGGLERILAAINNNPDIFQIDIFSAIIEEIEKHTNLSYEENKESMRVIADHIRAAVFLIVDGVLPSNKGHGYVLRRLLRRSALKMHQLNSGSTPQFDSIIDKGVLNVYDGVQGIDRDKQKNEVIRVVEQEMKKFTDSLDRGLKYFNKLNDDQIPAEAFNFYSSYGFPYELYEELAIQRGVKLDKKTFDQMSDSHRKLSQKVSAGSFKGGLADTSDQVVKYHTATHLLHQALKDVFGVDARQEGSNITQERLRFDVKLDRKPTEEEMKKVEAIINLKIQDSIPVSFKMMPRDEADKIGAASFFKEKYNDIVKVYFIGDYSKEFCGGPHVENTKDIGPIEIFKMKKIGSNIMRIYARSRMK